MGRGRGMGGVGCVGGCVRQGRAGVGAWVEGRE